MHCASEVVTCCKITSSRSCHKQQIQPDSVKIFLKTGHCKFRNIIIASRGSCCKNLLRRPLDKFLKHFATHRWTNMLGLVHIKQNVFSLQTFVDHVTLLRAKSYFYYQSAIVKLPAFRINMHQMFVFSLMLLVGIIPMSLMKAI